MIHESEIRESLAKLRSGEMSVTDLRSWVNAHSLNMHRDSSHAAQRLAGMVGLILAEHLVGDRTDQEVMEVLERIGSIVEASADMIPRGRQRIQVQSILSSTARISRRELLVPA
jgi:hypothetical protein